MSLGTDQEDFAECLGKLLIHACELGYRVRLGDTYPGKFRHSEFGQHPKGLAIDLNLFKDGVYLKKTEDHIPLGIFWENLAPEATWGGRWNDGNHYSWKEYKREGR